MAYTVKQLAVMSGVTVRTLHFYDEMALLKPAYTKANGYRIYEEPQLLTLQQILFYRELGFELKRINEILSQRQFGKIAALKSHRRVLEKNVTRTRTLIETIDKTISHLKGAKKMKSEELFMGFSIGAGKDRFNDGFNRYGTTIDCKVSGKDTGGAMCVLEVTTPDGRATSTETRMNGFTSLTARWSWRLARSGSLSELGNPCSSHAILSTRGRPSAPQPRSSILTNRPAKSRTFFRRWPNSKTYRRASRRLRKATPPNR